MEHECITLCRRHVYNYVIIKSASVAELTHLLSHDMATSSDHAHLVDYIPVFETVFQEPAIERVLVLAVRCSEVPIAAIVGSLVRSQVEHNRH